MKATVKKNARVHVEQFDPGCNQGTVNRRGILIRHVFTRTYTGPMFRSMCCSREVITTRVEVVEINGHTYEVNPATEWELRRSDVEKTDFFVSLHGDVDLSRVNGWFTRNR